MKPFLILLCGLQKNMSLSAQFRFKQIDPSPETLASTSHLADWLMLMLFVVLQLGLVHLIFKFRAQFKRSRLS